MWRYGERGESRLGTMEMGRAVRGDCSTAPTCGLLAEYDYHLRVAYCTHRGQCADTREE